MKIQGLDAGAPVAGYKDRPSSQSSSPVDSKSKSNDEPTRQAEDKQSNQYDKRQVENAVRQINETMEMYNTELRFTLHEESGEYLVKVVNPKDNTVIREIPPKKILDIVANVKEMLGIIVDKHI